MAPRAGVRVHRCLSLALALRAGLVATVQTDDQTDVGDGWKSDWKCAVRYNCADPLVKSACRKYKEYKDEDECEEIVPMVAEEDKHGRTVVTHDAMEESCEHIFGKWWGLLTSGADALPLKSLSALLKIDMRNEPVLRWLQSKGHDPDADIGRRMVAKYVVPRCVEVGFRVFKGGQFTLPGGKGVLTDVFGEIGSIVDPSKIAAQTFPGQSGSLVQVGTNQFMEHPKFAKLRDHYGVPHNFLAGVKIELGEAGGSGSNFIKHGNYILKCEMLSDWHSPIDWQAFHARADDYFDYMLKHPQTLLPRFFTVYYNPDLLGTNSSNPVEDGAFCFVMQNWIPEAWSNDGIWSRYRKGASLEFDFKGSIIYSKRGDTNSRLVRNYDRKHVPGEQSVLKDLNFVDTDSILLPAEARTLFLEQIARDTAYLNATMIMDYSLFLHRVEVDKSDPLTLEHICPVDGVPPALSERAFFQHDRGFLGVVPDWNGVLYVYSMGLIDILQPYSLFKAVGTAYDLVLFPSQVGKYAMNNIPPDQYTDRFVKFMRSITVSKVELAIDELPKVRFAEVRPLNCTVSIEGAIQDLVMLSTVSFYIGILLGMASALVCFLAFLFFCFKHQGGSAPVQRMSEIQLADVSQA